MKLGLTAIHLSYILLGASSLLYFFCDLQFR